MTYVERTAAPDLATVLAPLAARAAGAEEATLVSATVPVAPVDPIALHGMARPLGASLWLQPQAGVAIVGIGEAWSARQSHEARFEIISVAWRMLLDGAIIEPGDAPPEAGPVLLGGFAFDDEPVESETWLGFEAGCMTLPALTLSTTPAGSWLTASVVVEPEGVPPATLIGSLDQTWAYLAEAPVQPSGPARQSLAVRRRTPDAAAWHASVARLAGAVGRGRLDKAVLSREITLQAASDIDITGVLRRLEASAPESTVFAFTRGPRTFIGATPERLVSLRGRELRTMAMAGSARRADDPAEDVALAEQLLASDKEREEHEVVVQMLRGALAPVTDELEIPRRPQVARFRHVQHLVTPVSGRLRDDADVLTLVERLHPTPAVGGTPRQLALELISEEEPHERGWYAGPLGWISRDGGGEFVVALRSGVIRGAGVTLFAGCGIVADSDPAREWDESSAKLQALGSALGPFEP
ncbi:MAG: isochorismate synthase [Candidatus Limnocylindrales bacterium]